MAYVDLNTIHNPATGGVPPATWGDQIRDNFEAGVPAVIGVAGDIPYGTAADTIGVLSIGTAGQVLTVNAGATAPEWTTAAAGPITLADVYPVGCIYTTIVPTNPATVFSFGTWAAFGAGRVLVGLSDGDADFDTVEENGGGKTSSGTTGSSGTGNTGSGGTGNTGGTALVTGATTDTWVCPAFPTIYTWNAPEEGHTHNIASHTHTGPSHTHTGPSHTHTVTNVSVVQPYIVVYFWERIS
jgi:hypothetical protein